jgi:D-sedoheptulose 7-phosphate isomerase
VTKSFFSSQVSRLTGHLQRHDWSSTIALTQALARAWKQKRRVFIPVSKKIGSGLKIISLAANPSVITCLANDEGYDEIFSAQLKVLAEPGDLLIVLSGSGNSPNILRVLQTARQMKLRSFAVLGYSGGKALKLADAAIHFKVDDMQLAEDFQVILGHLVMRALRRD